MNKIAGIITTEERRMIRDYILLTHMLTMIQKSIEDLKFTDSLFKDVFMACNEHIENMVLMDAKNHRLTLKDYGIQVTREEHAGFVVYYHYICRGYTDRLGLTRDVMRSEISIRLGKYVAEIGEAIKRAAMLAPKFEM
ncbi:hypothetical protein KB559_11080 [Paenibacillus sp. Marseille-P2973]|uniref:hypothetical protein n=1 Tax=Paenibacillus sp. Marseille-P2973 TaxID=1871032 RepID=UPI001B36CC4E|nr:hypothetical protein [Paenibacillus sp. Marseille-P2973]MBQ4899380.1 hypothetical protein [Paenibacillus sp. Marseille-P2973]